MTTSKKELQSKLAATENLIRSLECVAVLLLCFYFIQILHQVFATSTTSLFDTLGRVGILISVLLASQVARRQLTFTQIIEKKKEHDNILRTTQHLSLICSDLIKRLNLLKREYLTGGMAISFMIANIKIIDERHAVLYEREIYDVLPTHMLQKIHSISGKMFSLLVFNNDLMTKHQEQKLSHVDMALSDETKEALEAIEKITEVLNNIKGACK